jgi:NAD(P)-dependent dehydrogenase (short-subunit alcohol dehydrogenase family)
VSVPMAFDEMAVVVTGVGGGIGLSTARAFGAAGACVVGLDMKSPENAEASFRVVLGDVADEATWDELAGSGLCPNGVDVIVNAAGVSGAPSPRPRSRTGNTSCGSIRPVRSWARASRCNRC